MPRHIVPAQTKLIAMIGIDAEGNQQSSRLQTGESAFGLLVVAIGQIPKQVVAVEVLECNASLIGVAGSG